MEKKPVSPWIPMRSQQEDNTCRVFLWDRCYTVADDVLFTSIQSRNHEILNAPMRLVGLENGQEICWQEKSPFVMEANGEKVTLCASQESASFLVNTALEVEYDGYCAIDIKIMPRGRTVAEVFGVAKEKANEFSLDRLWLEIPLKKEYAKLIHYWPASPAPDYENEEKKIPLSSVSMSRALPCSMKMPFKPILWLGTEEQGFCWFADSDENWEPKEPKAAIEIIDSEEEVLLRFHLVDDTLRAWKPVGTLPKNYTYAPLSFQMGIQATPVKPFPQNPYKEKILHIDCFQKIEGEYDEFLSKPVVKGSDEIGYDRIQRLGVTTLFIHEKWNKIQNYWELSQPTAKLARKVVAECHKRGIKVVPYFGYELSTLNPRYSHYASCRVMEKNGLFHGGWYRKPNQRAYTVCFQSAYGADMAKGIQALAEEYGFDGVYLDSTLYPMGCIHPEHGCGYVDEAGNRRPTYPVRALRSFMKELYEFFQPRGGIVNPHLSNCCNVPALSFAHLNWDGEHSQTYINANGIEQVPLDYLRTEYSARNFGVPYEFLAYTFENWSFRDSLSIGLIHGMLSRPNDIGLPLELMSPIWKAIDSFDMENALWKPYWSNGALPEDSKGKLSYYQCQTGDKNRYLIFLSNPTDTAVKELSFSLGERPLRMVCAFRNEEVCAPFHLEPRESRVLLAEEV